MFPALRAALLILVAGGAVYANSVGNGFTFDDHAIVEQNPVVHTFDVAAIWSSPYWPGGWKYGLYRPITLTSFALNRAITGPGPAGFHAVNLTFHLLVAWMVFVVSRTWVGDRGAMVGALVFALHPIQTEAVNGIVGRAELLATGLSLLSWFLYRKATPSARVGSVVAFATALMAKESALVLPAILIVEDAARAHAIRALFHRWRGYVPYLVVGTAFLGFRATVVGSVGLPEPPRLVDNPLGLVPDGSRVLSAVAQLPRYVLLVIAPVHLSPDYTYNQIPTISGPLNLWFVTGVLLLFGCALLLRFRWNRPEGFAVAIFWMALLPLSNLFFVVGTNFGERLLYLPMVGVGLLFGRGYTMLENRLGFRYGLAAVVAIGIAMGARTVYRNFDWRSDLTLFAAASRSSSESAKVHLNLGNALSDAGQEADAFKSYANALAIYPDYADAHYNRGVVLQGQGRLAEAREAYSLALASDPDHARSLINRGIVAVRVGDRSGIDDLQLAVEIEAGRVDGWHNYGVALNRFGRQNEARAAFARALAIDPTYEDAAIGLAGIYRTAGQTDSMIVTYRRLVARAPAAYQAAFNLGVELERMGRICEAVEAFRQATPDPSDRGAMALYQVAQLLDRGGRRREAARAYGDFLKRWGKSDHYERSARRAMDRLGGG